MELWKRKMGVIAALACIAAVAALVWFCLAGGSRQSGPGGTLVRVNGAPVWEHRASARADGVSVWENRTSARADEASVREQDAGDCDGQRRPGKPAPEAAA